MTQQIHINVNPRTYSAYCARNFTNTLLLPTKKTFFMFIGFWSNGLLDFTRKLPPHIRTYHVAPVTNQTLAGNFTANEEVNLQGVLLPEFHKTWRLQTLMAKIFDQGCRYDMILGRNLMNELGIVLNFEDKSITWDGSTVAMRAYDQDHDSTTLATNLLLDVIDGRLEANDSITTLDKPSDLHYQENDVDPAGYKTTMIRASL